MLALGSAFLPGTDEHSLSAFGFGADGAMVNSTCLFALVVLVLFAVVQGTTVPPLLVKFLQAIPVQQTRAASTSSRMVESMVTSAVQSTVNRSMDDPLLLAAEFARQVPTCVPIASGMNAIRVVVKLYKARTAMTPQFRLHKHRRGHSEAHGSHQIRRRFHQHLVPDGVQSWVEVGAHVT